jgi:hypothetical protein
MATPETRDFLISLAQEEFFLSTELLIFSLPGHTSQSPIDAVSYVLAWQSQCLLHLFTAGMPLSVHLVIVSDRHWGGEGDLEPWSEGNTRLPLILHHRR